MFEIWKEETLREHIMYETWKGDIYYNFKALGLQVGTTNVFTKCQVSLDKLMQNENHFLCNQPSHLLCKWQMQRFLFSYV